MIVISQETLKQGLLELEQVLGDDDVQTQLDGMRPEEAQEYVIATLYNHLSKLQPTPVI